MKQRGGFWRAAVPNLGAAVAALALLSWAVPTMAQEKIWRVGLLSNSADVMAPGQQTTWRNELLSPHSGWV